jgi:hypothetical protein
MPLSISPPLPGRGKAGTRRVLQHGVLALSLLCSRGAEALTLDALLRLPLERLLQLQVAVRGAALPALECGMHRPCNPSDGRRHVAAR